MFSKLETIRYRFFSSDKGTIPTTDLHFANACRAWIKTGFLSCRPITKLGANTFSRGNTLIVCRRDAEALLDRLLAAEFRLIYIMDDDLRAAEADTTLPRGYRERLMRFRDGLHHRLVEAADQIVVPSESHRCLYQAYEKPIEILPPYWSELDALPSQPPTARQGEALELGYLGTASHQADRAFVFDVIDELLKRGVNFRLNLFGRTDLPERFRSHRAFNLMHPMPWPKYRAAIGRRRFDLLLYPLMDTPFNQTRSVNKILEHAVHGAPGIYSAEWQFAEKVRQSDAGLTVPNDPAKWAELIEDLGNNQQRLLNITRPSIAAARAMNTESASLQHQFWTHQLRLDA
jgi:hypothetical protein